MSTDTNDELHKERSELLTTIQKMLEIPMIVLGFIWLILLVIELIWSLTPLLELLSLIIWGIFIVDFLLKFILAPDKTHFLRHNILTLVSLLIPALRVFRIARALRLLRTLRVTRGIRLVKVIGSLNRGMRSLSASLSRRKFGYVLSLTFLVLFIGAAGMYALENNVKEGFDTYGKSLWWTAMLLTTLGSESWPKTPEGRTLCLLLALYGFTVFGYFTATLATFFMGRDADSEQAEIAGAKQINSIHQDLQRLRTELQQVLENQRAFNSANQDSSSKSHNDSRGT